MASKKGNQHHVVPHENGWAVQRSGSQKPSHVFPTKREADKVGREISRNQGTEYIPHKKNGRFQNPDSHGNDPHPPEG